MFYIRMQYCACCYGKTVVLLRFVAISVPQVRQVLLRDGVLAPHGAGAPQRGATAPRLPHLRQALPTARQAAPAQPRPSRRRGEAGGLSAVRQAVCQ